MLWLCPKWEKQRRPYVEALANYIEKVGQTSEERKQYITETMKLPCVHKCGVIPEADYFTQGGAPIPTKKAPEALANRREEDIPQQAKEWAHYDDQDRIVAYTDGAAMHPDDRRRRRAAWGVFYSHDHTWNRSELVCDEVQTVYRAELEAVHHVITKASRPTSIYSDCLSVVNQLQKALSEGENHRVLDKGDHADLWKEIALEVTKRPPDHFDIPWIPSHTELEAAEELEARGGVQKIHVFGNHWADILKEETPLVLVYISAIRTDVTTCQLVGIVKVTSKAYKLKIPISRATASRNRQIVSTILVADTKMETGLKEFVHDVKIVEGLGVNRKWQDSSTITVIARV